MAKIKLTIPNLEQAIKKIGKFRLEKIAEVVNELDRTALMVESGAKRNIRSNGSIDTGRLWSSVVRQEYGKFNRTVSTNVEYAPVIEFGFHGAVQVGSHAVKAFKRKGVNVSAHTRGAHSRMMNRMAKPFLFPAAEAERQNFINNLKRILSTT